MMPLFKTEEFAKLVYMEPQMVRDWVKTGRLTPALPGCKGQVHRFSGQQALGMAVITCLSVSDRGCGGTYARKVLDWFEAMDDRDLAYWVESHADDQPGDVHDEEHFAKWDNGPRLSPILAHNPKAPPLGAFADDVKTQELIDETWKRIEAAIRSRMTPRPAQRTRPQPVARGKKTPTTKTKRQHQK